MLERTTSMLPSASPDPAAHAIAERFVRARLAAVALPEFPGAIPDNLAIAYACQNAAIGLWPDRVVGWKVGRMPEQWRERLGEPRVIGPIFSAGLRRAVPGALVEFPVFVGGFAAVEAEFILRLGRDAPPSRTDWDETDAAGLVDEMILGVETAGSPLATINELGPAVVVSDFGNNSGLILGPSVPDWRQRSEHQLTCETFIEGRSLGQGNAAAVEPLAALAHALGNCARRGFPLKRGDLVSTGAATGIHEIRAGEHARITFNGYGEIHCRAVPARANAA
jgi:2-keto-4-pentenoate hydratase